MKVEYYRQGAARKELVQAIDSKVAELASARMTFRQKY